MKISRHPSGPLFTTLTINGKKNFIYGETEEEVEAKYTEMKYKHNQGYDVNKNPTLEAYMITWYKAHKAGKGALKTQEMYRNCINNHINPKLGSKKVKEITGTQIQNMLNKISSSESLAHKVKITINQIFTQAIADRLITFNPVLTTKTQAPNKPKRAYLTPIQRDILLTILKNHRLYSLILLLLYTGMRMSEALSLTWEDIDLENGYVSVTKAAEYKNGRPILKDTKNCKHRIIPIADKHLLDVLAKRKELGKKHVFHGNKGGQMGLTEIERTWKHAKKVIKKWFEKEENIKKYKENGIELSEHTFNLTFRLLRHTYCTGLYDAEVDEVSAAEIMGHDVNVMREVYTHISESRKKQTIVKLEKLYKDNEDNENNEE